MTKFEEMYHNKMKEHFKEIDPKLHQDIEIIEKFLDGLKDENIIVFDFDHNIIAAFVNTEEVAAAFKECSNRANGNYDCCIQCLRFDDYPIGRFEISHDKNKSEDHCVIIITVEHIL